MLYVGDDWADQYHDIEIQDEQGRGLTAVRLPDGPGGLAHFHKLVAEYGGEKVSADRVLIGIETDQGPWVQALAAAGYQVYALNPLQVTGYRRRIRVSGAKDDKADAHTLADMVRVDAHQLRRIAADSDEAVAIKVVARAHKTLVWEQTRHLLRLRSMLREYFPAALQAFEDLTAPEALELLAKASEPATAARLSITQISAALKRAGRYKIAARAEKIQQVLRGEQLARPGPVAAAYGVAVAAQTQILAAITKQPALLEKQVSEHFHAHPDAEIYLSQPGLGPILGARVLGEFGDAKGQYATAKARKNYAGTSPITRQSGKKTIVIRRFIHQDRLVDALQLQAFSALTKSPGARAYYDDLRARGHNHNAALRQLANRLVGILHGCLKTGTRYHETTAWPHSHDTTATAA